MANTLYEGISDDSGFEGSTIDNDTSVLYHDTESVDPETGETVSVGNLETTLYLRKTVRLADEFTGDIIETVQSLKDDYDSDYVFNIDPKEPDSLQNIFGRAAISKKNLERLRISIHILKTHKKKFSITS